MIEASPISLISVPAIVTFARAPRAIAMHGAFAGVFKIRPLIVLRQKMCVYKLIQNYGNRVLC